jgi:riboflavin kinase/FMN adenylyltransferase
LKIIKGSRKLKDLRLLNPVITLGNFDGVHKGHQMILKKVIKRAKEIGGVSVVYTFSPHPLNVLRPEKEPPKITTFEEKAKLIEELGIEYLICENFTTSFAKKSPENFLKKVIYQRIKPQEIIIGHDYSFGKGRQGTVDLLKKTGKELGFKVDIVSDIKIKNIPVRSTTIRNLISEGKVSLAQKLMGKYYCLSGKVVHGKQRKIGFPTANLSHIKDLIPQKGVYAIYVETPHGRFKGAINIGVNPTFDGKKLCIETHIFNFDTDIYGKEINIFFVKRIRGEKKFKDAESLALQIKKDVSFINRVLKEKL